MAGENLFRFHDNFDNEELQAEFFSFFDRYNITPLFTHENRASDITVTYLDVRSVVNPGGQYHKLLLEMANLLAIGEDNKKYESALFRIIYDARSFQGMMNYIRRLNAYFNHEVSDNRKHNFWNIVWYNRELT